MKKFLITVMLSGSVCSSQAADAIKVGHEVKSAAGIEKIVAVTSSGADSYWISSFVRDGNCPENSGKCGNDGITVRAPGGVASISVEDASNTSGFFSQNKNPVAVVIVPSNKAGYAYASAEVFIFSADKKPVNVLKTAPVLLNNLEGAACEGKKLCADSKLTAVFLASAANEYPDVQLRQSGTTVNASANGLEKLDRTFSFSFDAQSKRYIAKK